MEKRKVLGLTEKVVIFGNNNMRKEVVARIDTGATNSSIDMDIAGNLELGPIKKTKIVKSASGKRRRPIISVKVKIAGEVMEDDFTVAVRRHMTYPVLIGQNILKKGNFLIDPNKN